MEKILEFFKGIAGSSWFKIVVITLCVALLMWMAAMFTSCGISRRSVTYGTVKKNYTTYDTIKYKSHVKVPKSYSYEEQ